MIYFIPTPIGNTKDITLRGQELLMELDCLIVENFQTTSILLKNLGREKIPKMISFVKNDNFNENEIKQALNDHMAIGVVSEAGMPLVSDPGYLLIDYLIVNEVEYTVLPGPCSVDTAVAASGLVSKGYIFLGFAPTKKGRQTFWNEAVSYDLPVVIFESVHRIDKFIEEVNTHFPSKSKVFIARELTKQFEEYIHTNAEELPKKEFTKKGEFVIVIKKILP
ncbi:MAG: 16S rRNA (cytidine(1402)-2'-O)-methyltransferase [Patescibacteria group bacterium]